MILVFNSIRIIFEVGCQKKQSNHEKGFQIGNHNNPEKNATKKTKNSGNYKEVTKNLNQSLCNFLGRLIFFPILAS